jgi:hypothetical protein
MVEKLRSLGGRQWVTLNDPVPAKPAQTAAQAPLGGQSKVSARAAITGHGDPEGAVPGNGQHIQQPPTGPSQRPDDAKPIPAKRGLFELLKSNANGLALASGVIVAVAVSWFLLFPMPPEIEFAQTKFPRYEGKAVEVLIRTLPAGREHEVKVKPPFLTNAGETRVTASIPGKMFGAGRTVSKVMLVPYAEATITFDPKSLGQSWQDGDKKIELSVTPSVDPRKGDKPLKDFVRLTFKREGDPEWKESYDKSRNGTYQVRAQIDDPNCNYKALAETNLVVSIISRFDELSIEAGKSPSQVNPVPQTPAAQLGPKTTYLIAAGGDILQRAIEAGIWKSGPSRFTVRNWNEGGEAKALDITGKVEGKQAALDEPVFVMKEGLLPLKKSGLGQAGGDTSVYTAEYGPSGQTIALIGLGSDDTEQISQNAVRPYVKNGAWLRSQDGGKYISVECGDGFCDAVSLFPDGSQFILSISTPEIGQAELPPSKTPRFDASELLVNLEKRRDLLREEIKAAKDPKNASSEEKVYFESNIPYLVAKLTNAVVQKPAEEILAASLAEEIKKLPTPQGTQTNRPTEFEVASALYIGALNAAYVNPSIGPRLQLNKDNLTTLANERNPSQKTQVGGDDKKVRSFWLLEPNALKQWMQLQNKVTAAEVIKHSYEWLDRRVRLLQPLKEQSPLHDTEEEVLRALRDGFQVCSSSPQAAFKASAAANHDSKEQELKVVEARLTSLKNIGTPAASGSAALKVQFPDGRSFTLLSGLQLTAPTQINR